MTRRCRAKARASPASAAWRWMDGLTWLWTSYRNQAGQGDGSSQLEFDQLIEPGG